MRSDPHYNFSFLYWDDEDDDDEMNVATVPTEHPNNNETFHVDYESVTMEPTLHPDGVVVATVSHDGDDEGRESAPTGMMAPVGAAKEARNGGNSTRTGTGVPPYPQERSWQELFQVFVMNQPCNPEDRNTAFDVICGKGEVCKRQNAAYLGLVAKAAPQYQALGRSKPESEAKRCIALDICITIHTSGGNFWQADGVILLPAARALMKTMKALKDWGKATRSRASSWFSTPGTPTSVAAEVEWMAMELDDMMYLDPRDALEELAE